ncbi:MAG: hypothetical protein WBB37_02495 [bacterium]
MKKSRLSRDKKKIETFFRLIIIFQQDTILSLLDMNSTIMRRRNI